MSDHGATRWRNIALGGTSAFAARTIAVACGFVQVPLALQYLGTEGFGIWVSLQALAGLTIMLDLGTGYHLQNATSAANVHGSFSGLTIPLRSALWTALTLAFGLAFVACFLDAGSWPGLSAPEDQSLRTELGGSMGGLIALLVFGIPAGLGQRLATGMQQSWLAAASQAVSSFITLILVLVCSIRQTPITVFLAITLASPIAINAGLLLWMLRRMGFGWAILQPPSSANWLADLRHGSLYFVPQLGAALRQTAPPFIVAAALGVSAVTPFNLVQRLMNLLIQPQLWLMEPLWAAYADAKTRRDYTWIRRTLKLSLLASVAFALLPLATSCWWGAHFLEWWTGHPAGDFPTGLVGSMAAWFALTALAQPIGYFLSSQGEMKGQVYYGSVTTLLGLAAMGPACQHGGLAMACLPLALALGCINLPCAIVDMRRVMRSWQTSADGPRLHHTP
jgi:O-antigen/teichoic acid export membrane protein